MARFGINKTVMRIDPARLVKAELPQALAETLLHVPPPAGAEAWVMVCRGRTCLPPITDGEALLERWSARTKAVSALLYPHEFRCPRSPQAVASLEGYGLQLQGTGSS